MPSPASEDALVEFPVTLARLHNELTGDALVDLVVAGAGPEDLRRCADVALGAGFDGACTIVDGSIRLRGRRVATLPDYVGPSMDLLVCGLNPSLHSVRDQVGFSGPGNRFWPALAAAGLSSHPRDAALTLRHDRIGMTDLVKRATPRAEQLTGAEYRDGADRVERLVQWLTPAVVCFVGLGGWRAARCRTAVAGPQNQRFGGRPVYVMPSTSGLNTHTRLDQLIEHLRAAAALPR